MEILKIIIFGSLAAVVAALCWFLIYAVYLLYYFMSQAKHELKAALKEDKQNECDHCDSEFDEGHPDLPWKCNDCGFRH